MISSEIPIRQVFAGAVPGQGVTESGVSEKNQLICAAQPYSLYPMLFTVNFSDTNKLALLAGALLFFSSVYAQSPPDKMDLYLLIGQSNMAGRGKIDPAGNAEREGIWVIQADNQWKKAKDPLHYDKPAVTGVGPGMSFAEKIHEANPDKVIGLIPCAVGGSRIDDWAPGQKHEQTGIYAYDAMLERVKNAQKNGRIRGILWHQGEGDSTPEKSVVYNKKLKAFFKKLRKDIGAKKVPVIIGTLGDFYVKKNPVAGEINRVIEAFPLENKRVYAVSSSGLTDLGDGTHFDAASARELGRRYAERLLSVSKK